MKWVIGLVVILIGISLFMIFDFDKECDCSDCFSCLAEFDCKTADCSECSCSSECISYEECRLSCVSYISSECEACYLEETNWRENCECSEYVACLDKCNC